MMIVALLLLAHQAHGHGYFYEPASRTRLAEEAGVDYCPACALAAPMESGAPGASGRDYPGSRAFADPGTAPSAEFFMDGDDSPFGVCGQQKLGNNDYNYPGGPRDSEGFLAWGEKFTEVKAGDIIEVSWCSNADHGGVYAWRMCDKKSLVEKLWANGPMSGDEQAELEKCYQDGILRCDDVPGNDCTVGFRCQKGWGCAEPGEYFHCGDDKGNQRCELHGSGQSCPNGNQLIKRKVRIPRNFPTGPTVMSWRWDSLDTVEVFAGCADIIVTGGGGDTPSSPPPPESPTKAPVASPVSSPTPDNDAGGYCCWDGPSGDKCSACASWAEPSNWCAPSKGRCNRCGHVWCSGATPGEEEDEDEDEPTPVPAPVAPPRAKDAYPGGGDFCCFKGRCKKCFAPVFDDYFCGQSDGDCSDCGGKWCTD